MSEAGLRVPSRGDPRSRSIYSHDWLQRLVEAAGARPIGGLVGHVGPDFVAVTARPGIPIKRFFARSKGPMPAGPVSGVDAEVERHRGPWHGPDANPPGELVDYVQVTIHSAGVWLWCEEEEGKVYAGPWECAPPPEP